MSMVRRLATANRERCRALERRFPRFFATPSYLRELERRIERDLDQTPGDVLEVGGIDRPLLKKNERYTYDGLDVEERERCHQIYDTFLVQSIEEPLDRYYQLVFSTTVLEHVPDNRAAFESMYRALVPGGTIHHYTPSKNHPYALCLRLVGPRLQRLLIRHLRPNAVAVTGYPAFFDYCTPKQMRELALRTGFSDVDVKPYYRGTDYFAFFIPAFILVGAFENLCKRFGWDFFASGFVLSARRPGEELGAFTEDSWPWSNEERGAGAGSGG
jgi:SAM-dependent methyltransferase